MEDILKILKKEVNKAIKTGEVPIAAVLVKNGKIISKAHNSREKKHNVCGHAEILAIQKASKRLKSWKLSDCDLYVTLNPCSMCEEVIKQARIRSVYAFSERLLFKKDYKKTNFVLLKDGYEVYHNFFVEKLSCFFKNKR